ncbi:type-2 histone deacetylase 2 [Drosophila mojavensis]|uniref:PHD-type domain-containing protein n=1 Tax=Drosophila mojavensis TaxID=7230 RepID=B4L1M3_DROMO|nr:type-2 histone deacetylase 2 [Drosophila mojavensis]EDW07659.1 uncharacterized protein Dmoj_GI15869 [Drosophila mojavensis]
MKRGKDEDKDDAALVNNSNNNNSNSKTNKESPNIGSNSTDANSSGNNNTPCTVRTTGRVKKPKLVYDPSDNYVSRGSRHSLPAAASSSQSQPSQATPANANALQQQPTVSQSPASSQSQSQSETQPQAQSSASQSKPANQQAALAAERPSTSAAKEDAKETVPTVEQQRNFDTCMKCGKSEAKRGSGYKSNFLTCKSCALKWHFTCLPVTFEVLTNARKKFKCEKCRRCFTCMSNKAKDKVKEMIMCSICANAYHLDCHWPAIMRNKLNDPKWKCDTCCPNYNPYNGEADEATKIQPKSPPRKSKAGRKKRATSDPAAAAVAAKKAALQQSHNKNENTENSKPIIISNNNNNNNNNSNNIKNNNDNNTKKPSTIVSQAPDNDDVVQVISKDEIDVVNGIIDLAPLTNYSPDTSLPTLTFVVSQEDKENDDSVEIIEDVEDIVVVSTSVSPPIDEQIFATETVQTWSIDDVVDYVEKFYPREAEVFRTQEIDGAALMVLSRQDVIDRFGLKLGPALRIYELVLNLQTSMDDVSIGWCD